MIGISEPSGRHHKPKRRTRPLPGSAYGWSKLPALTAPYSFRKESNQ